MAVTIRAAQLSDAEAIAALTIQLGYRVDASGVADRLSRQLTRTDQRVLVADSGGRVIGWIHMVATEYIDSPAFVLIAGLVVDRTSRHQGIGRQLVAQAEEWASRQGCSVVRLSSNTRRTEAHAFYERAGYANVKTQYSFAKALGGDAALRALIPDVT
jgi:predicted N-acetyltransferase YhbS